MRLYRSVVYCALLAGLCSRATADPCRTITKEVELPAGSCPDGKLVADRVCEKMFDVARLEIEPFVVHQENNVGRAQYIPYGVQNIVDLDIKHILTKHGANEAVLIFLCAHETGHAIQHRRMGGLKSLLEKYAMKQIEAHADLVGGQLAVRAGYSEEIFLKGRAEWAQQDDERPADYDLTHPTDDDRLVNILGYQRMVNIANSPKSVAKMETLGIAAGRPDQDRLFDSLYSGARAVENDSVDAAGGFTTALSPAAFDEDGRLRPSQLIPEGKKKDFLRALMHLPTGTTADEDHAALRNFILIRSVAGSMVHRVMRPALDFAIDSVVEPQGLRALILETYRATGRLDARTIDRNFLETLSDPARLRDVRKHLLARLRSGDTRPN